ncbi:MAG: hypothetical protein ABIO04_07525 [Ferruginibacter sp.]
MHSKELFKKLFNRDIADAGSSAMLNDLVTKYPYFSLPHFFLLKGSDQSNSQYKKIAGRTTLHFDNPYLLNYRLKELDRIDDRVIEVSKGEKMENVEDVKMNIEMVSPIDVIKMESDLVVEHTSKLDELVPVEKVPGITTPNISSLTEAEPVKNDEPMIFEPLFASDYFASQGIKLSEEVQPGDKLGKQLKSFTDWLKSMKKVHDGKLPPGNEQIDIAVQNLAEKSNIEDDILTESMAEAYLQQEKPQKAIEIYRKLSLLDPSKNAYFAAKIDQATAWRKS